MMIEITSEKLNFVDFFSSYTFIIGIFLLILGIAYFHATWITRNNYFNIDKIAWIVEEISLPTRTIIRIFPLSEHQMILASTSNSSQYITNLLHEDTTGINMPVFQNDISDLRKHILVVYGPKTSDKDENLLKHLREVAGKRSFFSFHKDDSIYDISSGIAELTNFAFALLITSAIHKLRDNQASHRSTIFSFPRILQSTDLHNDERIYRHSIETRYLSATDIQKNYVKRFFSKKCVEEMILSYTQWIPDGPNKEELVKMYTDLAIDKYCNYVVKSKFFKYKMNITRVLIEKYPHILDDETKNPELLKLINIVAKNLTKRNETNFSTDIYIDHAVDHIYRKCYINNDKGNRPCESLTNKTHEEEDEINFDDNEVLEEKESARIVHLSDRCDELYKPRIMAIDNAIYGDFTNRRHLYNRFYEEDNVNSLFSESILEDSLDPLRISRITEFYGVSNESNDNLTYENSLFLEARRQLGFINNHEILELSRNNDNSSIQVVESTLTLNQNEDINIRNRQRFNVPDSDEEYNENNESNGSSEMSSEENINETIKLKFLNDEEKVIPFRNSMKVGDLKRIYFKDAVNQRKMIRLIFSGQLCRDDNKRLTYYGIQNGSVVHVHISNFPTTSVSSTLETEILNTNRQSNIASNSNLFTEHQNLHSSTDNFDGDVRIIPPIIDGVQEYLIRFLQTGFRWLRRETENENISPNSRFYFLYTWYINLLDSILQHLEAWHLDAIRPRVRISLGEHIRNNFLILMIFVSLPPIIYFFNTSMTSLAVGSAFITCFVFCISFIILMYIYNFWTTS